MGTMRLSVQSDGATASHGSVPAGSLRFDLPETEGGSGTGLNGGEALMFAVAGCYANDLRRRARELDLALDGFRIHVESDWGSDPVMCQGMRCRLELDTRATKEQQQMLVDALDAKAAIPAAIRRPTPVALTLGGRIQEREGKGKRKAHRTV